MFFDGNSDSSMGTKSVFRSLHCFKKKNFQRLEGFFPLYTETRTKKTRLTSLFQLTPDQVAELREAFNLFDTDGSGSISTAELGSVLSTLGEPAASEELNTIVNEIDKDGEPWSLLRNQLRTHSVGKNFLFWTFYWKSDKT